MTHESRCPSCGHANEAAAAICSNCNFPLRDGPPAPPPAEAQDAPPAAAVHPPGTKGAPAAEMRRIRPVRPRRPGGADQALQTQLIVGLGGAAVVMAILWVAWQGFHKNNAPPAPVEGANPEQMQAANLARAQLARDSTNVNAQIALANVLYDTANWTEAIVHYKSALRLDPTRVTTVVDMGVCYYNLSDAKTAETLFTEALKMDPRQPVALFNLGIVSESRGEASAALDYFQRALKSNPPPGMEQALNESITRINAKLKGAAPGGSGGAGGGMPGGGAPPGGGR